MNLGEGGDPAGDDDVIVSTRIIRRKKKKVSQNVLHSGQIPRWSHGEEVKVLWSDGEYYCAVIDKPTPKGYTVVFSQYGISREVSVKKVKSLTFEDLENAPDYWCALCRSGVLCAKTLMSHVVGRRHLKKVDRVEAFLSQHDLAEVGKKVDLRDKQLGSEDASYIGYWLLTNTIIKELCLESNLLEGEGIHSLCVGLAATTTIRAVDCRGNPKLVGEPAETLAGWVMECKTLKTFSTIPVRALKTNDDEINSLYLTTSGCGAAEAFVLSKILLINTSLKSIDIRGNIITDTAAEALATSVMDTYSLETLSGVSVYALQNNY